MSALLVLVVALGAPFDDDVATYRALGVTLAQTTAHDQRAELELQRVRVLKRLVYGAHEAKAVATFCNDNRAAVIRSKEACGVDPEPIWSAAKAYSTLAAGEALAWEAATTPMPGCKNDRACERRVVEASFGRYTELQPNGQHAKEARERVEEAAREGER